MNRKEQVEVLSRYLRGKGYKIEPAIKGERFDFWVDSSYRIVVKIANKINSRDGQWRFNIGAGPARMDADFFICITSLWDTFVIPEIAIPRDSRDIRFAFPSATKPKGHRWQQYLDKFSFGA